MFTRRSFNITSRGSTSIPKPHLYPHMLMPPFSQRRETFESAVIVRSHIGEHFDEHFNYYIHPTPSFVLRNEDPNREVNQAYCLCNQIITLSPLPASSAQSANYSHVSIPGSSVRATKSKSGPPNARHIPVLGHETCTMVSACTPTELPAYICCVYWQSIYDQGRDRQQWQWCYQSRHGDAE
jgi:hypothetical protein